MAMRKDFLQDAYDAVRPASEAVETLYARTIEIADGWLEDASSALERLSAASSGNGTVRATLGRGFAMD